MIVSKRALEITPTKVGNSSLQHRIVLAPLTRFRASDSHVPITELVAEYYAQRAAVPGTLLLAEGTLVSPQSTGWPNAPGIWSKEQVAAWKEVSTYGLNNFDNMVLITHVSSKVVDAVHARGSFIYLQIFAMGRVASPEVLEKEGPFPLVSSSDIIPTGGSVAPRPLTIPGRHTTEQCV